MKGVRKIDVSRPTFISTGNLYDNHDGTYTVTWTLPDHGGSIDSRTEYKSYGYTFEVKYDD